MNEFIVEDLKDTPTNGYACRACNRMFAGLGAFDDHRVGPYGDRRCDTSKLLLDDRGYYRQDKPCELQR